MIKVFEEFHFWKKRKEQVSDPLESLSKEEMFKRFVNKYRFKNKYSHHREEFNDLRVITKDGKIYLVSSDSGFRPEGWEPYEYGEYDPNWSERVFVGVNKRKKEIIDEFNKAGTMIYKAKLNKENDLVTIYDKDGMKELNKKELDMMNKMKDIDPFGEEEWEINESEKHLKKEDFKPGDVVRNKITWRIGIVVRISHINDKCPILVKYKSPVPISQHCDPSDLEKYEFMQIFSEKDPFGEEDWGN